MIDDLTYIYYRKASGKKVYLVLHGSGDEGISSPFISSLIDALIGCDASVFGFNFPYCERKEGQTSGPELSEEVDALSRAITFLRSKGHTQIIIVAKSLGGIVASFWLKQNPHQDVYVVILGYVIGSVTTEAFTNTPLTVIQGQHDRFGDAAKVKIELMAYRIVSANIIEIPDADHSYRDASGQPAYQPQAIEQLLHSIRE